MVIWARRIASFIELARDWIGAVPTGCYVRCFRHGENCELGSKLERELGLQLQNPASEISDLEESLRVNALPIEHVTTVDMSQANRCHIQTGTGHYSVLDSHVIFVLFLDGCAGFDFDQAPETISTAMQSVHFHEHAAVLERSFKNGWDFWVGD
jgi:hypothetical protein